MFKTLPFEYYKNQFISKHGDKYLYNKSEELFKNARGKIIVTCRIHGDFLIRVVTHARGSGCKECGLNNTRKFYTLNEIKTMSKNRLRNDFDYSNSEDRCYRGFEKINATCVKHNRTTSIQVWTHLDAEGLGGCKECWRESMKKTRITKEEILKRCFKHHGSLYNYSEVDFSKNMSTKAKIICPEHGAFYQTLNLHCSGQKCPICAKNLHSLGERTIEKSLIEKQINFEREKIFPDLKGIGGGRLKFDFFLPLYNTLIEFDGKQHQKPVKYWGGEETFKALQENDKIKNNYALAKDIKLIRITRVGSINKEINSIISSR